MLPLEEAPDVHPGDALQSQPRFVKVALFSRILLPENRTAKSTIQILADEAESEAITPGD